jgi:hypothetical protein
MTERRVLALEAATILVIAGLALWSVRPLLEEWGTLNGFNELGPFYPWSDGFGDLALRPLHMGGYLLQWVAGGGRPIGVAIVAALVMVARYAVIRWAVSPFMRPLERWVVSTFGAVLFAWPGAWFGRYIAAQISALLFFAAVGFSLRLARRATVRAVVFGVLAACAALLFYQALAIAMLLVSVLGAAWAWHRAAPDGKVRSATAAAAPFAIGLGLYFLLVAVVAVAGAGGYEARMIGEPVSLRFILDRVFAVYASAFGDNVLTAPLLLAVATGFLLAAFAGASRLPRRATFAVAALAVLALPTISLPYVSLLHARDLDRTLFPVSVGFVAVLIAIGIRAGTHDGELRQTRIAPSVMLVLVCLVLSTALAHQARAYWNIQSSIIVQMLSLELRADERVVLKDTTGVLGDMYTFHTAPNPDGIQRTRLRTALRLYGVDRDIQLCTPSGTDRLHPVARRHPVPTTARCEEESGPPPQGRFLVAKWGPSGIVIAPAPTRWVERGEPVLFDAAGAGEAMIVRGWSDQEAEFRWSEGPTAVLSVAFADDGRGPADLILTLDPFLGGDLPAQRVGVDINGVHAGNWQVDRRGDYAVAIPPAALDEGQLTIELTISDPTEPCQVTGSGDCRPLGVAIRQLAIN